MLLGDNSIHITHYINPHCFYYKPETAHMQEHEQAKFAAEFNELCETEYGRVYDTVRNTQSRQHPQPGDLVALRSNQLQRWIRCEMEELTVDLDQTTWYFLWAIDEGLPIKSQTTYVRPLPQAFRQEPAHAKRGAIINILPAETQFDYVKDEQILAPSTRWSPGIVSTLELMLDNAESISFLSNTQYLLQNETINVGELFITTQTNASYNVAEKLREACADQMIVTQNENFLKEIEYLRALSKKRYLNNEGFNNHAVNNFVSQYQSYDPTSHAYMDTQTDTKVAMKVYEWLTQNKKARIAILEQQKADKDRMKESATTNPSASVSNKYMEGAKHEVDKEDDPIWSDLSFLKFDESKDAAVLHCKPSNVDKKIKRHLARLQLTKTETYAKSSIASE